MAVITPGYSPKRRGIENKKRRPVIIVNAEGNNKTETNYLKKFASNRKFTLFFSSDHSTDPLTMVKNIFKDQKEIGFDPSFGDRAFCLIDSDFDAGKNKKIKEAENYSSKKNIDLIVSGPCFEIWFICHFIYSTKQYKSAADVVLELQKYIPKYAKNSDQMFDLLSEKVDFAVDNAKKLEAELIKDGKNIHSVEFMPSTEVYRIVEYIRQLCP